jgi:ABC-type nitrate/sulfonate/bicarbonate transport system permease component
VILAIMGILLFQVVAMLERVLFPWSSGAEHAATPAA